MFDVHSVHKFRMKNTMECNHFRRKFAIHAVASGSAFDAYPLDGRSTQVPLLFSLNVTLSYVV